MIWSFGPTHSRTFFRKRHKNQGYGHSLSKASKIDFICWGTKILVPNLILTVTLLISLTVTTANYLRPQPRETLHFQWSPKPSSYPQQVTLSSLSLSLSSFTIFLISYDLGRILYTHMYVFDWKVININFSTFWEWTKLILVGRFLIQFLFWTF